MRSPMVKNVDQRRWKVDRQSRAEWDRAGWVGGRVAAGYEHRDRQGFTGTRTLSWRTKTKLCAHRLYANSFSVGYTISDGQQLNGRTILPLLTSHPDLLRSNKTGKRHSHYWWSSITVDISALWEKKFKCLFYSLISQIHSFFNTLQTHISHVENFV